MSGAVFERMARTGGLWRELFGVVVRGLCGGRLAGFSALFSVARGGQWAVLPDWREYRRGRRFARA